MRSQRPGFIPTLRRELRDYYCWHGDRIDWVSLFFPISIGALFGLLISLTIESGETYLVTANTMLWAAIALAFVVVGALGCTAAITLGLAIVIGVEITRERNHPRKERRRSIRENTRMLEDAIVDDRVPLQDIEKVRTSLRIRDESAERNGVGWYERILVNRWRRQRERVEGLLEISWQEALPEAIEYLKSESSQLRWDKSSEADLTDSTEVAWHLAYNPTNVAVQRLLVEYVPAERQGSGDRLEFRTGVVYTPRWVYALVRPVENHSQMQLNRRWAFSPSARKAIGNECAPIGDVDRETVEKLYEPHGDGPLGSIRETIETARNV